MPELILFGVSFRTAPVAVRKTLTFDAGETGGLLRRARAELPGTEALVLSTCNRTEFYLGADGVGPWHDLLKRVRPAAPATLPEGDCRFYERRGVDAFRHLARLAGGLDSAILGDSQLPGQLRAAVTLSQEHRMLGPELGRATSAALRLARAARAETRIAEGSAGIGSAVAATVLGGSPPKRVAVLGAGEAARSVARHLVKRGVVDLVFCNRTGARAQHLTLEFGGTARPWSEVEAVLETVDTVVVATSSPAPVLGAEQLGAVLGRRRAAGAGELEVIDAGFPPQVDGGAVPGLRLTPLEAIRQGEEEALAARQAAVPAVEAMVEDAVAAWLRWQADRRMSGTIRRLQAEAQALTRTLTEELVAAGLPEGGVDRIVRQPVQRLLHGLITELRAGDFPAA